MPPAERLQKILASAGLGSRRAAEALIAAGRVTVDGATATLGTRADPARQRIEVDGRPLRRAPADRTLALHKPPGYLVTARDERGRPTVFDLLPDAALNLRYVGRLDQESEGLLLLTTDGALAHRLAHPRWGVEKRYEATVRGAPAEAALEALRRGVLIEDGRTAPARVELVRRGARRSLVRLSIHEGRNRQVRRMLDAVGHPVTRLVRTSYGPVELGRLGSGRARELRAEEIAALRALVGLESAAGGR
ncbi:MAG: rRNA pseudouridine synthase [Chloroflexi bacterium]|nr:rRNA pseudouridine synthase [Chloroflexota bacterium]